MDQDLQLIISRCLDVLSNRPSGLMTDIDGTISYIAPTPDAASVGEIARGAIRQLSSHLDIVGTVSGRAAENAERMVDLPGLLYVGNHGLERRQHGQTTVNALAELAVSEISTLLAIIRGETLDQSQFEGVLFENKGVTASIHYRLAPDQDKARVELLALIEPEAVARNLRVTEGRMVIEIRPSVHINKGTALVSLAIDHGLRGIIFLGDDTTDIDGFRGLARLREDGTLQSLNIAVVSPESPPEVALSADVVIQGVDRCVDLLAGLAHALETHTGAES